jgi:hypothetical protein
MVEYGKKDMLVLVFEYQNQLKYENFRPLNPWEFSNNAE